MLRKRWSYKPEAPARQAPHDLILNPLTRTASFAVFPTIPQHGFREGEIRLTYGMHRGPNHGWGLEHIWREHFNRIEQREEAEAKVCALINMVLAPRTPIYYEKGNRAAVFKGSAGLVIVEARGADTHERPPIYSIVTAYKAQNAKGTRIGAL